jgi:hypothetical protein
MINFLNTPPKFSPVYTDGLFFTVSADTNYFKFRYVYDVYVDNVLIFQGKATPNPFELGVIDVSRILKSYVSNIPISKWNTTPIYTHETFPFSRPNNPETINYQVYVGYEYASSELAQVTGFTGNDSTIGPPEVTDGLYKTFQSTMGVNAKSNEQNFDIGQFVLSGTPTGTNPTVDCLYLTNSPRNRDLDPSEYYTLGFTNYYLSDNELSEPYYVLYNFYDEDGLLITGVTVDNITTNGGGPRTSCNTVYQSTVLINPSGNTDYNTLYVGAGPMNLDPIMPPNAVQYTVQLFGKFTGTTSPIQPSPTPTPTPTPTPIVGPCDIFECASYAVTNENINPCEFTYWDCLESRYRTILVAPQTSSIINCSCPESFAYECDLLVQYSAPCITPSPCTTCYSVVVTNNSEEACTYTYYNCTTQTYVTATLPGQTAVGYPCICPTISSNCESLEVTVAEYCSGPLPTPTPSQGPNTLNWYFSNLLGVFAANTTLPNLLITQSSTTLVNVNSFSSGVAYFTAGFLTYSASFVYQNNVGSINNIAIVAGTTLGDDTYGRLDIPSPSNGTTYTLSLSPYFPASGNLYVTILSN